MTKKKRRIAILTATYPPYHGGTGNVCQQHARQLVRLGHEVVVFTATSAQASKHTIEDGIIVWRLKPLLRLGNGVLLPQLLWRLRGFDVIHWHYPFFGGEFVALAAKLSTIPLIVTYHQDVILSGWLGKIASMMEQTVSLWALKSADIILFTSHDYAQHSKMRPFLRPEQIDTLSNGVDLARFAPSTDAQMQHTDQTGQLTALLVAGLDAAHYFKGVSNFLAAIAAVAGVQGIIVGDGDLREQYERQAHQHAISELVHFMGRVNNAELPEIYRRADVTVLPSTTMGEAFGLVLVESLASSTPVIASNLPGVRTVVDNGVDGLLVKPNDVASLALALRKMRDLSPAQRREMGRSGRQKVLRLYGWEEIGRKLSSLYEKKQV